MSSDPRREPENGDDHEPTERGSGIQRRVEIEAKLAPLPQPPAGKEEDPFYSYIQKHNEVQRQDRILLFLDNEEKAEREDKRRAGYEQREKARDARDAERERKIDEREADSQAYMAQLAESFGRLMRAVEDVSTQTRANTLALAKLQACVSNLETNQTLTQEAVHVLGKQIALVDGKTTQISNQFEVAMTNTRKVLHTTEERVDALEILVKAVVDALEEFKTVFWAEVKARSKESHGSPATAIDAPSEAGATDNPTGDDGGEDPAGSEGL